MLRFTTFFLIVFAWFLSGFAVSAQSTKNHCVICNNPNQLYVCQIKSTGSDSENSAEQLYCASKIAEDYKHDFCSVQRSAATPCEGKIVAYKLNSKTKPVASRYDNSRTLPSEKETRSYSKDGPRHKPAKRNDDTPDTLVGLADKAAKDTRKGLRDAGKKINDAAKNTYDCVTSWFFRDCF